METIKFLLFLLVLAIFGGGGILWVWGGGDGRYHGEGAATVNASNAVVTQWLLEPDLRVRWVDGLSECRRDGWGRWEKGAKLEETLKREDGRLQRVVQVTDLVEGRRVVLSTDENGIQKTWTFELKTHNTGAETRIAFEVEVVYHDFWSKLFEPILGSREVDAVKADLARLDAIDKIA